MIDRSQLVQPGQAQHDLAVQGHAAADQAGVSPLRDDGHPGVSAQGQDRRLSALGSTALAGAPGRTSDTGAAYVFTGRSHA